MAVVRNTTGGPRKAADERQQAKIGEFAVGCVAYWVTRAGHIWREFTGRDIGIDGEIEITQSTNASPIKILVQVKGTKTPSAGAVRVDKAEFHWRYWRIQRSPVLLCEVAVKNGESSVPPFAASSIRWIDVSRAPEHSVERSRINYNGEEHCYKCKSLLKVIKSDYGRWERFVRGTVSRWPNTRIEEALSFADELIDAAKAPVALDLPNGIEQSAIVNARADLIEALKVKKLRAERHGTGVENLTEKSWSPKRDESVAMLLEQGYWHVVAAMTAKRPNVPHASKALSYFRLVRCRDRSLDDLITRGFSLYGEMVLYLAERWDHDRSPPWSRRRQEARLAALAADRNLRRLHPSKTFDARLTLWKSHLIAQDIKAFSRIRTLVWAEARSERSASYLTALHYEHAILLEAWTLFVLSRRNQDSAQLEAADALLRLAGTAIRGCLTHKESHFWLLWVERRIAKTGHV